MLIVKDILRRVYKRVNMNGKQIGLYFSSHGANDGEKNFWDNLIFHRRDVSRCPEISSCLDSNVNQEREQCLAQHACICRSCAEFQKPARKIVISVLGHDSRDPSKYSSSIYLRIFVRWNLGVAAVHEYLGNENVEIFLVMFHYFNLAKFMQAGRMSCKNKSRMQVDDSRGGYNSCLSMEI